MHDADPICSHIQQSGPDSAGYLFSLAMLRHGRNSCEESSSEFVLACLKRAVHLDPDKPIYLRELGNALIRAGHWADAVRVLRRAISLAPTNADAYVGLGHALAELDHFSEALVAYNEAQKLAPSDHHVCLMLGDMYRNQGRPAEALLQYDRAICLGSPAAASALYRRIGLAHVALGAYAPALESFRKGLKGSPSDVELMTDAGETLLRCGSLAEAMKMLRAALNFQPRHARACRTLAFVFELLGQRTEANEAWLAAGCALDAEDRLEEAAVLYGQVIEQNPRCVRAHTKLGWAYLKLAYPHKAVDCFEKALSIDPENTQTRRRLGYAAIMAGDEARGYREWKYNHALSFRHRFEQPMWDGGSLHGRTILTWAEFALGDTLLRLRYLSLLKNLGARVLVECQATLLPLVQRMPCVDGVVARGAPLPAFDLHAPLLLLAAEFRENRLGEGIPYLTVDPDLVTSWRERLLSALSLTSNDRERTHVIGLCWSGSASGANARYRFTNLSSFAPLIDLPRTRFVSLQLGRGALDLVAPPVGLQVDQLLDDSCTGADTAALMMNLDLVVTVDSMVAHLAGALGRPVWILTWTAPAWWLWQNEGEGSAWYPNMRLFRQSQRGDWTQPINRVRQAIVTSHGASNQRFPNTAAKSHTPT